VILGCLLPYLLRPPVAGAFPLLSRWWWLWRGGLLDLLGDGEEEEGDIEQRGRVGRELPEGMIGGLLRLLPLPSPLLVVPLEPKLAILTARLLTATHGTASQVESKEYEQAWTNATTVGGAAVSEWRRHRRRGFCGRHQAVLRLEASKATSSLLLWSLQYRTTFLVWGERSRKGGNGVHGPASGPHWTRAVPRRGCSLNFLCKNHENYHEQCRIVYNQAEIFANEG